MNLVQRLKELDSSKLQDFLLDDEIRDDIKFEILSDNVNLGIEIYGSLDIKLHNCIKDILHDNYVNIKDIVSNDRNIVKILNLLQKDKQKDLANDLYLIDFYENGFDLYLEILESSMISDFVKDLADKKIRKGVFKDKPQTIYLYQKAVMRNINNVSQELLISQIEFLLNFKESANDLISNFLNIVKRIPEKRALIVSLLNHIIDDDFTKKTHIKNCVIQSIKEMLRKNNMDIRKIFELKENISKQRQKEQEEKAQKLLEINEIIAQMKIRRPN